MTDPTLSVYQLKVWKRNLPSFIVRWQRDCLCAMNTPYVQCTHISNEPLYFQETVDD